jgi:type I restriction enzyme, S subunit
VLVEKSYPNLMLPDKILRVLYDSAVVDARYLLHALRSRSARIHLEAEATGTSHSMRNLSQPKLRETPIPLAPLPEQQRIADRLDVLLTRVHACRDRLDRVPAILKRFRQSVLRSAISGDLTADWRGKDIENWTMERAADICSKVQSGGTPKEGFSSDGIPFLKVYNIVNQQVDFDYRPQFIAREIHNGSMSKSKTQPGDVLMNIVGPPLGKVAMVPASLPECNINQAITLFRPSDRIQSRWLYYILRSGHNVAAIEHETKGSAGQTNISLSQCRDFVLPVPPVDEQTEIVCRVDALFALADTVDTRLATAHTQVDCLTPALLAKAFRGDLVPQDPRDEPASRLLERIASAKQTPLPGRKRQPPSRRSELMPETKQLSDIIDQMPKAAFTFDELRQVATGDYESLKDELFALLADKNSGVEQFFDVDAKSMKLRRVPE